MKEKLIGWWMCIISRISKWKPAAQFYLYTGLFLSPSALALGVNDSTITALIVIYLVCMYAFFVVGFRMIGNGGDKDEVSK
jgi:hypothetical protein